MEPNRANGNEFCEGKLAVVLNGTSGACEQVIAGQGRLINLSIEIDETTTTVYPLYLLVYDSGTPGDFAGSLTPTDVNRVPRRPLLAPIKVNPGETIDISPETKWLPFRNGIMIVISTSASEFLPPNFDLSATVGLNYSFHVQMGAC